MLVHPLVFEKQSTHAVLLALLVIAILLASGIPAVERGALFGVSSVGWLWSAVGVAVLHQVYVWFCWRTQLHGKLLTRVLGDAAFPLYAFGFAVIGIARVVVVILLAISNAETLPAPMTLLRIAAIVALIPSLYLFYSVGRYFGFRRAFGIDHFDPRYRTMPLVKKGIFRFTSNGMYIYGFMLLWAVALWWGSAAALVAAVFNHVYIWVHYVCTERPDMQRLYGGTP